MDTVSSVSQDHRVGRGKVISRQGTVIVSVYGQIHVLSRDIRGRNVIDT